MGGLRPRTPAEYLVILWRRRLIFLLMTTGVLTVTFMVIRKIPDRYESCVLMLVAGDQAGEGQVAAVTQQVTSRSSLVGLVRRYHLRQPGEDNDRAAQRLAKELKLETKLRDYPPQVPELITITYRHTDPRLAQEVLASVVSKFNEANEAIRQRADAEASRLSPQIAELEASLSQLSQRRAAAARPNATPGVGNAELKTVRLSLVSTIESLDDKKYSLEQQIAGQQRLIAEQERAVNSAAAAGARANSASGALLTRKAELEAQLKVYTTQYTDKNPKVIQTHAQLAEVDRQLARLETGSGPSDAAAASPEARELRSLQLDLARMQTELEITQRGISRKQQALASLPETNALMETDTTTGSGQAISETGDEYERLVRRYNWLLDRQDVLQKGRPGTAAGSGTGLFQLVDPPGLPRVPVAPNRLKLKLAALAIAVGMGLMLAAALEVPRLSLIENDRDVEYYLGVPVMGLIQETLTPAERSRRRRQRLARGLGLALLALAAVPAVVMLISRLPIFQLMANR